MTSEQSVITREDSDGVAILTADNPPVNATGHRVRDGLKAAVETADNDPSISALVIRCAGRTFFAGADIKEFGLPPQRPILFELCEAIEACSKPVVAAIHGTALGGGFEIAMASHYRVATKDARVGMPEVKLGLTPGAGGTQRLPRLIGLPIALEIITSGRQVSAQEAHELGAIDQLADGDLLKEAIAAARSAIGKPVRRSGDLKVPAFDQKDIDTQVAAIEKKARGQNSPMEAARLVLSSTQVSTHDGTRDERATFMRLMDTEQAKALRHIFMAEREAAKVPGMENVSPRDIKQIGVVGAGIMGSGIAIAMSDAGYEVTVVERDDDAAGKGLERITANYQRSLKSGRIDQATYEQRLGRIDVSSDFSRFSKCELVIEAVFDDLDIKRDLFEKLSGIVSSDCILATNTSYLDPNLIAKRTNHPERVVGMHFFAPAFIMRLLEVVRAEKTAPEILATAIAVGKKLRKLPIVAGVCTGFIGNRIYACYRKQAEFMLEEGALPAEIDAAMESFGLPMGPFRAFDLSGLDISWALRKRQAGTRDPNARYCHIPDRLCEAGRFGQKSGVGYYRYENGKPVVDADTIELIKQAASEKNLPQQNFSAEDIQLRLISAMANEGGKVLSEGIALRESDINLVFTNGYGWPAWRGGPMFQARMMGLDKVVAEVRKMEQRDGSEFSLSQWLLEQSEQS